VCIYGRCLWYAKAGRGLASSALRGSVRSTGPRSSRPAVVRVLQSSSTWRRRRTSATPTGARGRRARRVGSVTGRRTAPTGARSCAAGEATRRGVARSSRSVDVGSTGAAPYSVTAAPRRSTSTSAAKPSDRHVAQRYCATLRVFSKTLLTAAYMRL